MVTAGEALPAGWTEVPVSRVGLVRLGAQRSPARQTGEHLTSYLRAANVRSGYLDLADVSQMDFSLEEKKIYALRAGDVLLAEASGSADQVGRAAVWAEELDECCFQNTVIRFRPHAVLPEYAAIVFRHFALSGLFKDVAHGVGILHLGAARFGNMMFPLPPLADQERIASEADRQIAVLRSTRESLSAAQAGTTLQVSEILRLAATGELISRGESTSGQAWTHLPVAEVGDLMLGRQRAPQHQTGDHIRPYLRVANVQEDYIDTRDVLTMNFTPREFAIYELSEGDILLNEGQSPELVGRPAMYRNELPGACFQNSLIRFRAGPQVLPEFALLVFRHFLHSGEFKRTAKWSTNIAHLTKSRFASMSFPVPSIDEQRDIIAEANRLLTAAKAQAEAIKSAESQIPDMEAELFRLAVTGELVPPADSSESAEQLLARVGEPADSPHPVDQTKVTKPTKERVVVDEIASSTDPLARTLRESGGALDLPDLFRRSGFDANNLDDIERFYLGLRTETGSSIQVENPANENAHLRNV